ncbi:MAG: ABC transporter permease, partial [Solirubrobacteraceae bacterium]|nr:ABC transporter permease [Solirubrobacteraceae bacterium]
MTLYVLRRLVAMVGVLFVVTAITFSVFWVLPNNDPAVAMAGKSPKQGQVEAIRKEWGFDKSLPEQYVTTMRKVFTGDLRSYANSGDDVMERVGDGIPRTLSLTLGAAVLMILGGVALGVLSARRAGRLPDRAISVFSVFAVATPVFLLGALVSYFLGSKLGLIPPGGYAGLRDDGIAQWAWHLVAPCLVLAVGFIGVYARVLRSDMITAMRSDYVRTARAKGLPEQQVVRRHGLRTALIPTFTLWGLDIALILGGGAILTEKAFDLGGVG